jgi:ketosteroid isomerase-like protein
MKVLFGLVMAVLLTALPAAAQAPSSTSQELMKLENAWSEASMKRDGAALQRFYADEYVFTDADGVVTHKSDEIQNLTSGMFRLKSYKFDDLQVHLYGEVAVVTGRNTISGVWEDIGRDVSGPYRFTDVFVMRDGRWQCVASQSSRVTGL